MRRARTKPKPTTDLSQHPTKGYRLQIGYYFTDKGQRTGKVFWFGRIDPREAEFQAGLIREIFRQACPEGIWTDHATDWAKRVLTNARDQYERRLRGAAIVLEGAGMIVAPGPAATPAAVKATAPEPAAPTAGKTLYQAITAYTDSLKGKRKSDKHKQRAEQVLNVNLKHVRKDCPLADVDQLWIDKLCDHFKSRPPNQKDGKPLSPATVKGLLTYLRLFFTWLDDVEFGGWQGPRRMLKCFKVRMADLMTAKEVREGATIKQFDVPTLKKLYATGTPSQRSIMLTALFTGATQQELAVMEKSEFDLDNAKLDHHRNKTKVRGIYWLPPELVTLLRAEFAARPDDVLVWRTEEGNPLVTFRDNKQVSDAVRQMWLDLRTRAELPDALPFKYLRKWLGDWMIRNDSEEMGQVALSQSRQTVLARNYTTSRNFDRLHQLQQRMHAELSAAGLFDLGGERLADAA